MNVPHAPETGSPAEIEASLAAAAGATRGHFRYESGHHGDLWLDLDALFVDARQARGWATALARQAAACRPALVCGPLTGGALLAQAVAAEVGAAFCFAERVVSPSGAVRYSVPPSLRGLVPGRRLLLVDDAINAGSALLSTLADLGDRAQVVGIACLLALGARPLQIARERGVPLYRLAALDTALWAPATCPLCASGMPLSGT